MIKFSKYIEYFIIILVITWFSLLCVYAWEDDGGPPPEEPTPQDRANSGDTSGMTDADWDHVKQKDIPPEHTGKVPPSKVKVNEIKDQSRLTYEQLNHGDNYNLIKDKSKLDPQVRDQFLTASSNTNVQTETNNQPTAGEVYEDGFYFDNIYSISLDDTIVTNAEGFTYQNNIITIDHADSIILEGSWSFNVDDAVINTEKYKVGSADEVTVGDIRFNNVQNSTFSLIPNGVIVYPEETLNITDSNEAALIFQPNENSKISIKETIPSIYQISNGTLISQDESFSSNHTATIEVNPFTGFGCINIEPTGTYYKTYDDIRKDFALHVYQESYKLCLKKTTGDTNPIPTTENNYGLINFITNTLYLNGKIQYLRYPFKESIISANFKNIYDGQKSDTKTTINLDTASLSITKLAIVQSDGFRSISNPAEYMTIVEEDTTTWVNLSHKEIKSINIAQYYINALLMTNILRTGLHEIHPYSPQFINNYIHGLIKEENKIYGVI